MIEYKKTWRVVVECDSEQVSMNIVESLYILGIEAYIEDPAPESFTTFKVPEGTRTPEQKEAP